ncbi:Magnesium-transporting ATPase, P-type 1 [Methylacidiphilum fumariolicum SolV]|uniref:Magnesium-transporting ATPase, P-type 1 n=3 Tax=Candidatus Methylacidiphilum fumarolicum TaxID=591154 RepID=I0K0G3_METFB|nr:Magnesium-transporting ATPase, P-type 1 [Candidatus Methylacidiphilum fumarolicum]CCG92982.1 Magnesium-transporting ATPase, P-type 1 [Methylacidiphilum fumariolicum SolV]
MDSYLLIMRNTRKDKKLIEKRNWRAIFFELFLGKVRLGERKKEAFLKEKEASIFERLKKASQVPLSDLYTELKTRPEGLTEKEVEERLEKYGYNEIKQEEIPSWFILLLQSYFNPFALLLTFLALVAGSVGEKESVLIMMIMVVVSVVLRFSQEFQSSRAAERLKAMVRTTASVKRTWDKEQDPEASLVPSHESSQVREVPISQIVPGDILQLSAGDMIPADVRLIFTRDLFVSQGVLTGESMPVEKYDTVYPASLNEQKRTDPFSLPNIAYLGTNVISGTATAVVLATGENTYFGAFSKSLRGYRTMTSFDVGVNRISWLLLQVIGTLIPVIFLINGFTKGSWMDAFLFSLAVGVGLTPTMLPVIVSGCLARGALLLSKNKVVTKRLNAIQNIGAMNILCTDKTGTLTHNKIILEKYLDPEGNENEEVLKYAYINSYYQSGLRNLLDQAVLDKKEEGKKFIFHYTKVDEIPFDFTRRRMSVVAREITTGKDLLITKGAVEEMIAICGSLLKDGKVIELTPDIKKKALALRDDLNSDGLRVLAVAFRELPLEMTRPVSVNDEEGMTLCGFIAFLDPPKHDAEDAVRALKNYGVEVKIITGDNELVTRRICDWIGLEVRGVMRGSEIENLTDDELITAAEKANIFVKMSPLQKARVIRALRTGGHIVGFLGDGINDAQALREADVGISVDTAVDIAKESADIILLEKSLIVLEQAVIEGRVMFGNMVKYIKMAVSSNFGNVLSILGSGILLPFLPMSPLQILILNLIYDLSQTLIPWDRMDEDFIAKPRKWEAEGILRFMFIIGPISSVFDYVTYGVMWFVFGANSIENQSLFHTGWFVESLLSQSLIVHMIRTRKIPFIQSIATKPLVLATAVVIVIGHLIPYSFFGEAAGLVPLPFSYYLWLWGILLTYCITVQTVKNWYIKRFYGEWL